MSDDDKHITVTLGNEEYAIHVQQVREIVGPLPVTAVPNARRHVLGVMNLRGKVVPVIDLAAWLDLRSTVVGARSCMVVCHGPLGLVGLLVDAVVEVVAIRAEELEPPPLHAGAAITGLAKVKNRVLIVLDVRACASTTPCGSAVTAMTRKRTALPARWVIAATISWVGDRSRSVECVAPSGMSTAAGRAGRSFT